MPTTSNERAIHASTVIVCEGEDEYDILKCLRTKRGWTDRDVELQNAKGRTNIRYRIEDTQALRASTQDRSCTTNYGWLYGF